MKGQVSVEFISLLAITLIASSVLVSGVTDRRANVEDRKDLMRAEDIAQKTAYTFEYVISERDVKVELDYSPELEQNYTINVTGNRVEVKIGDRVTGVGTAYSGESFTLNSKETYNLSYDGGVIVE